MVEVLILEIVQVGDIVAVYNW